MEVSRRNFLELLGIGAAATIVPTQFKLLRTWYPTASMMPLRRKCRAVSGLARTDKFKMFVRNSLGGIYEVTGKQQVTEADGRLDILFPSWIVDHAVRLTELVVVDDEGFIVQTKKLDQQLCVGDQYTVHFHLEA